MYQPKSILLTLSTGKKEMIQTTTSQTTEESQTTDETTTQAVFTESVTMIQPGSCESNEYECASYENVPVVCIKRHLVCDGTLDCLYGDDESQCGKSLLHTKSYFRD